MKSLPHLFAGLFGLATAALLVVVWRQHQEIASLETAAVNPAERTELQKRVWDAEKRVQQAELLLAASRSSVTETLAPGMPPPDGAAPESAQNRVVGNVVNAFLTTMNDPEAQKLMAAQQKAAISARHADLFKLLQLPPDKLEEFKAELLDKQTLRTDVLLAAVQQGINPLQNPKEYRQLEQTMQAEIDAKIKTTLGDAGYATYQEFQATAGQRAVVNQLRQSLSYTATPLTDLQATQMTQVLAQTGPQRPATAAPAAAGGAATPAAPAASPAPSKTNARVTDLTVQQSQAVLLPSQMPALKEIQQQQQAGTELERILRQNQAGGAGGLPVGSAPRVPGR